MLNERSPADEFSSQSLQTLSERVQSDGEGKSKVVGVSFRVTAFTDYDILLNHTQKKAFQSLLPLKIVCGLETFP